MYSLCVCVRVRVRLLPSASIAGFLSGLLTTQAITARLPSGDIYMVVWYQRTKQAI